MPLLPHRPPVIVYDGWREFLVVHDRYYLWERREWKQRLLLQHPDHWRKRTATRRKDNRIEFDIAYRRYVRWERREHLFYAQRGIPPPRAE